MFHNLSLTPTDESIKARGMVMLLNRGENNMKQLLILLSLMLCFGSASGQQVGTQAKTSYLKCDIDSSKLPYSEGKMTRYRLPFLLLKIDSPYEDFSGMLTVLRMRPTVTWVHIKDSIFYSEAIAFNLFESKNSSYPELMGFKWINRQSLSLTSINFEKVSDCNIVSKEKALNQYKRDLVKAYNKDNQI